MIPKEGSPVFIGKWSGAAIILVLLTQREVAAAPLPETVPNLIAQLSAADDQARQQASDKLEKLGGSVLPALRQAAAGSAAVEVQRRLELVVTRIENNLVKAEEKHWQDLDASRRGVKDRLVKIVARTPTLTDAQRTSAVYLLTVGRSPTDDEVKRAQKQFVETNGRAAGALSLARSLVQSEEFSAEVADANARLLKVKVDLGPEKDLVKQLHVLNSDEVQKMTTAFAGSLTKRVKTDGPLIDLAFLLVLSRFPKANETERVVAHLKKTGRLQATEDIFWSLLNTKEFLQSE
jgi:hypothetical protein